MESWGAFVRKEFIHIFRDKRTMMILLLMPIVLIVLFGYAITTEVKRVPIAILDQSRDEVTQKMISHFAASEYFELYKMIDSEEEGQVLFRQGKIRMALIVESGKVKGESEIQLLVDATDPNEATQLSAYATQIAVESGKLKVESENANSNAKQLSPFIFHLSTGKGIVPTISLLYNPQMKGAYNFVPGVMGLILILICAMMTSVGIVKEKEIGTMEVLLVSPMKPVYIILAKATPYLLLSLVNIATILALSYFLLDVPINGRPASVGVRICPLRLGSVVPGIADLDDSRHPAGRHADQCCCPDAPYHIAERDDVPDREYAGDPASHFQYRTGQMVYHRRERYHDKRSGLRFRSAGSRRIGPDGSRADRTKCETF